MRVRYVIIGNSAAAIGAVEGIRQVDANGEITIVTSEPHHTYSRPLISYLLLGKVTHEKMGYRGKDFYERNGCKLCSGATVSGIAFTSKQVVLASGERIPYDKLLVATGSSAFVPPFEGLDTVREKFTFAGYDDANKLDAALGKDKRVLIVGAGLIGLKCAEGILARVAGVTVLDLAPRILSSILDEGGAAVVQRHLEDKGLEFKLSVGVKKFEPNAALLDDGTRIEFDILVLAVGVRPNTGLLNGVAEMDKGIVVDERSKTTAPDIYAAGDCTQTLDISSGQSKIMALLPSAYMQGECAGVNMAGGEKSFDTAIPMNAIGFFGLHMVTAGNYTGDVYASDKDGYKRLFYKDNRLCGYIIIGDVSRAGIYTSLIRERTPLDSIDFALVCKQPGLMAFAKQERQIKLGEAK